MRPAGGQAGPTRRSFLIGSVGTGLMMAFGPAAGAPGELLRRGAFSPSIWFEIAPSGIVTVNIAKAEMGQHVGTALAQILADELGAAWSQVRLTYVDSDPRWGIMITASSWSVFTSFETLSKAGAAGRIALMEAAADMLGVPASACSAREGVVRSGNRKVSYAEIVSRGRIERSFSAEELDALPVMPADRRRLIGASVRAADVPEKTDGTAVYGIDLERPGMLHVRPIVPPTRFGSRILDVDDSDAKQVRGYLGYEILEDPSGTLQGWAAVVADSQWAAMTAGTALRVRWQPGASSDVSEDDLLAEGERLVADPSAGAVFVDDGNVRSALEAAHDRHVSIYRTHGVLHFPMEPMNAVVEERDGIWHVDAGNQWQSLSIPLVAKALGVSEERVVFHQHYLGGGFGRRAVADYVLPAALVAKRRGKAVKVVFTREDDSRADCFRSPSVQRLEAGLDAGGRLLSLDHAAAAGWPTLNLSPFLLVDGLHDSGPVDTFSISGADHWYDVQHHRVRAINNALAQQSFQPGWVRGVGPGWVAWALESFIDELAALQGVDPLRMRLDMLTGRGRNAGRAPESVGGASRAANVLRLAAERAGWGRSMPAGSGQGLALTTGQERNMPTWIACVAEVSVSPATGRVDVQKLTLAVDCGTVVNPDGALAQVEGAALWGLSVALHEGTGLERGEVRDLNLDSYTPLRMADVPELDVHFVPSTEHPTGLGEPPSLPIAPAVGNAVFAATGVRMRDLPISRAALRDAIASSPAGRSREREPQVG